MIRFFSRPGRRGRDAAPLTVLAFVASAAMVGAPGCAKSGTGQNAGSDSSGSLTQTSAMRGDDVIATVNNDPITAGQLFDQLQHFIPSQISGYPQNPVLGQAAGRTALQNLIVNTLAVQLARDNGVPVTPAELEDFYRDNVLLASAQQTTPFDTYLARQGYSLDQYKLEVLAPQVAQMNLLSKTTTVTPQELQDSYNAHAAVYTMPERVHLHRIATADKATAQTVYAGLESGKSMSDFAAQNIAADGAGGNPDDNTDIAQWLNVDQPVTALGVSGSMLKTAKVGDILPPTQVQGQWWVIQVAERRHKELIPFAQVQDLVRINLVRQKAGQNAVSAFQGSLLNAMQHAEIVIKPPQYQSIAIQLRNAGQTQAAGGAGAVVPGAKQPPPVIVPSAPVAAPPANASH